MGEEIFVDRETGAKNAVREFLDSLGIKNPIFSEVKDDGGQLISLETEDPRAVYAVWHIDGKFIVDQ